LDAQPGRWDGTSMLRAAWGPFEMKKQLMISAGIAWDRWASGFPVVRAPLSGGHAELDKAEEIGRSIRNHERAYVAFQGPPPTDLTPDGWSIDIAGGPAHLPDPVPLLKEYSYMILQAGLMTFMALGNTPSASRAVGQVQELQGVEDHVGGHRAARVDDVGVEAGRVRLLRQGDAGRGA